MMVNIGDVLSNKKTGLDLPPNLLAAFKYAPVTSCDVERSFSAYKNVLIEKRTNFTEENIEKNLICYCFSSADNCDM